MALDRMTRFLGRRPPASPDLAAALVDLGRLSTARPELEAPARSLAKVLSAAFEPESNPEVITLEGSAIQAAWREGVAVFHRVPPSIDSPNLRGRALAILEALRDHVPAARAFRAAIRRGAIDVSGWASEALAGRPEILAEGADAIGIDPDLAASVVRFSLLPTLARITLAADLASPTPAIADCPWCGSAPLLAEMRGLERDVRLRCGLCAGDWPGGRLRCPACGEEDHHRLATRFVAGEGDRYRLSICLTCGSRLKLVGTLGRLSPPALIVADLATVHLDLIDLDDAISSP